MENNVGPHNILKKMQISDFISAYAYVKFFKCHYNIFLFVFMKIESQEIECYL